MKIPKPVLDVLDRAARSTLQKFIVVAFAAMPAVHAISEVNWYQALGVGAGAGVLSILMSVISWEAPVLTFWPDLLVRMGRTFAQSLITSWGADYLDVFNVDWTSALAMGLSMTGLSLVSGLLGASANAAASPSLVYSDVFEEAEVTDKRVTGTLPTGQLQPFVALVGSGGTINVSSGGAGGADVTTGVIAGAGVNASSSSAGVVSAHQDTSEVPLANSGNDGAL